MSTNRRPRLHIFALVCYGLVLPGLAGWLFFRPNSTTPRAAAPPQAYTMQAALRAEEEKDLPERAEMRQRARVAPGARLELSAINGPVDIEVADTDTAEIQVALSARDKETLAKNLVQVDARPDRIVLRGPGAQKPEQSSAIRQRVHLKVPRKMALDIRNIVGRVSIGALEGPLTIQGVNGRVDIAQINATTEIAEVNGSVGLTIARPDCPAIHLQRVNGSVALRCGVGVNADVRLNAIQGEVAAGPTISLQGPDERGSYLARLGAGRAPVLLDSVNGSVSLERHRPLNKLQRAYRTEVM